MAQKRKIETWWPEIGDKWGKLTVADIWHEKWAKDAKGNVREEHWRMKLRCECGHEWKEEIQPMIDVDLRPVSCEMCGEDWQALPREEIQEEIQPPEKEKRPAKNYGVVYQPLAYRPPGRPASVDRGHVFPLYMAGSVIERIKLAAYEERLSPSRLTSEVMRQWLESRDQVKKSVDKE